MTIPIPSHPARRQPPLMVTEGETFTYTVGSAGQATEFSEDCIPVTENQRECLEKNTGMTIDLNYFDFFVEVCSD